MPFFCIRDERFVDGIEFVSLLKLKGFLWGESISK